jgi:hypothetical protein
MRRSTVLSIPHQLVFPDNGAQNSLGMTTISIMALMKTTLSIANVSITAGKPYGRVRFSPVHLPVLTSLDQRL